jgi:hypothetical protein
MFPQGFLDEVHVRRVVFREKNLNSSGHGRRRTANNCIPSVVQAVA